MPDLTPYLCVTDSRRAIDWYGRVFGATVSYQPIEMPDGRIGHVELAIGDATMMMSDEFPDSGVEAPDPDRGNPVTLHLAVPDCDAVVARATEHRGRIDRGPEDTEHGRVATLRDPFGHRWMLNTG